MQIGTIALLLILCNYTPLLYKLICLYVFSVNVFNEASLLLVQKLNTLYRELDQELPISNCLSSVELALFVLRAVGLSYGLDTE